MKKLTAAGLIAGILIGWGCSHFEYRTALRDGGAMVVLSTGGVRPQSYGEWNKAQGGWPLIRDLLVAGGLGVAAYGYDQGWFDGSDDDPVINVTATDSSRVVVGVSGASIDRALNSSSFNSSKSSSSGAGAP